MTDEQSTAAGAAPVPPYEKHLYFALFICLIGLSLFAVALTTLGFPWVEKQDGQGDIEQVANLPAWGILIAALIGVTFLFVGLHSAACLPGYIRLLHGEHALARRSIAIGAIVVGLSFCLFAGYRFYELAMPAESSRPATQFALAVPVGEPDPAQPREEGSVDPAAADQGETAVMFWSVPQRGESERAGLMNMLLASLLTIGFGLVYPRIAASGDQEGTGFVQKLVVPALGLALFGVGVGENAQAEERKENVRLVQQNLPPLLGSSRFQEAYVLEGGDVSRPTSRELGIAIRKLIERLEDQRKEEVPTEQDPRLALIQERLASIEKNIREGVALSEAGAEARHKALEKALGDGLDKANIQLARTSLSAEQSAKTLGSMSAENWRSYCLLRKAQLEAQLSERKLAMEMFRRHNAADSRDVFERVWIGLSGINAKERQARADFELGLKTLSADEKARVDGLCDESAVGAQRQLSAS
jgi:hypothetical protein